MPQTPAELKKHEKEINGRTPERTVKPAPQTGKTATGLRRRHPKHGRFKLAMLVYCLCALLVIGIGACVGISYIDARDAASADNYMHTLTGEKDGAAWKDFLLEYFPQSYPSYENGEKLATEVLAPRFEVGTVTYMRYASHGKSAIYELFSDGAAFATVYLSNDGENPFSLGEWRIETAEFKTDFFGDVEFRRVEITAPVGAVLTVNGVSGVVGSESVSETGYPEITPAEAGGGVAPCLKHVFSDVYYVPEISATLDGEELELCSASDGSDVYYFRYPNAAMHTLILTAPEGISITVGGAALSDAWARRTQTEGDLGELDDGGSGERPMLNVWTIDGIFGTPEVKGTVAGKNVSYTCPSDLTYVFETPAECKYSITILAPVGSVLTVNGRNMPETAKCEGGASAADLAAGLTILGSYSVAEFDTMPEIMPRFDKYTITGYLVMPRIEATLDGEVLESAGITVSEYYVLWEFDYPASDDATDKTHVDAAEDFARKYIEYVCEGGAFHDPDHAERFNKNYEELMSLMLEGTAGCKAVMQSYSTVYKMAAASSFTVDSVSSGDYIEYSSGCVSVRVDYSATRRLSDGNGGEYTETLSGSIDVLRIYRDNEWRVWSFVAR